MRKSEREYLIIDIKRVVKAFKGMREKTLNPSDVYGDVFSIEIVETFENNPSYFDDAEIMDLIAEMVEQAKLWFRYQLEKPALEWKGDFTDAFQDLHSDTGYARLIFKNPEKYYWLYVPEMIMSPVELEAWKKYVKKYEKVYEKRKKNNEDV